MTDRSASAGLLRDVSRAVFWNAALLPIVMLAGLLLSIVVRRSFGLESGVYDAVLGIGNSLLFYSSLGVAASLAKFLPEMQVHGGQRAAAAVTSGLAAIRMVAAVALVIPLVIWAGPFAEALKLGPNGGVYLRWLAFLVLGRAALDYAYRVLDALIRQLSVNILSVIHTVLDVCLVATVVAMGLHLTGVFAALGISAVAMAVAATIVAAKHVQKIPAIAGQTVVRNLSFDRVWKLSGVTYLRDLSLYFATPAFASPALLGVLGSPQPVALFATSYFVASSAVTLAVSGFRGIYRPAFARVLVAGERADLQRAFDVMTKVQILAVVPAGFGLGVMVADYLPLLYGAPFEAAVPIARVLIALLFAETALAIALVVLWSDEQYGPVLAAHAVLIVGAPLFVWTAGQFGLLAAAAVLGGSRLAASAIGHVAAVRRYEVRYPWQFAMKVVLVSSGMAAVLLVLRHAWGSSLLEAAVLTLAGVVMVLVGLRALRVIEAAEIELLERARVPGGAWIARWLEGSNASAPRERREVRND